MNGWIQRMVVASLLCGLTGVGSAQAEGGRIIFSGAVVVPTCAASNDRADLMAANSESATRQLSCDGKRQVVRGDTDVASYGLSVVPLSGAQTNGNPLLEYFTGYLSPAHAVAAKMITRTYE
ncbi:hypothetical protein AB7849_04680 [Rhodanobacter sp. 115]|jgi:hypothetical protein|uniref:hypothetical protein n=1 Tax=Rhodanobacter sp. FW021-MT20 TaxID=1162282 RepID=UPI0012F9221B|nr:hypothetical protein [Rhodanobacter sp. 115]